MSLIQQSKITMGLLVRLHGLRKNLSLKKAELEEMQKAKLCLLLNHAYRNVPYYRRLFDESGVKPEDIRTVEDLKRLPITDKATLRSMEKTEITAVGANSDELVQVWTSGSTGMPTGICFTRDDHRWIDLVYLRSFLQNGLRFRDRRAFVLDPHSFETKKTWYHKLGLGCYANVSCFADIDEQVEMLRQIRPDLIHGYSSSLRQIGMAIIERNIQDVRPRLVSTAAELLRKRDREIIALAFGTEPHDRYAARECGCIAWECNLHTGYHINSDCLVVEFVKNGEPVKPGSAGEVVITNLHSYAMPFIRYRIGDIGIPSLQQCPCGCHFPMMQIVEGRDEDFIVLRDGRRVSPMVITGTLDYVPGLKQFRVIQDGDQSLLVMIARGKGFGAETVPNVENGLRNVLDADMKIRCEVMDEIPREKSGKVRAVISRI